MTTKLLTLSSLVFFFMMSGPVGHTVGESEEELPSPPSNPVRQGADYFSSQPKSPMAKVTREGLGLGFLLTPLEVLGVTFRKHQPPTHQTLFSQSSSQPEQNSKKEEDSSARSHASSSPFSPKSSDEGRGTGLISALSSSEEEEEETTPQSSLRVRASAPLSSSDWNKLREETQALLEEINKKLKK